MDTCYIKHINTFVAKLIFTLFFISIFLAFFVVTPALAAPTGVGLDTLEGAEMTPNQTPTGLGNAFKTDANSPLNAVAVQGAGFNNTATFESIVSTVITTVLAFMGVIFLVLAIYGGYTWMTARGDEQKVEQATKTITNAIIGLVVVLSAYVISWSIVNVIGAKVFK